MTTRKDTAEAEIFSRAQRAANAARLVVDAAYAGSDEARNLCEEVKAAAAGNKAEYERLLQKKAVVALFCLGALKFDGP